MNKLTLVAAALTMLSTVAFGQKSKVSSAENAYILGQIDQATADIEEALNNPKSQDLVKTNLVAARIFSKRAVDGKDDEGVVKGRKYLERAVEIDQTPDKKGKTGKEAKAIAKEYITYSANAANFGVNCFNNQNYNAAKIAFINVVWANSHAENYSEVNDSVFIYNAAIASMQAEDYETAAIYFDKCIDVDYDGPMSALRVNYCYEQTNASTEKKEANLKKGFEKYPENKDVLITLINYYINAQRNEDALVYLNEAIAKDSDNPQFYFARGCLYEKIDTKAAIDDYQTALAKKPDFFNALYNIAVVYYNQGVEVTTNASSERDQKKYDAMLKDANVLFEQALPYMEKASLHAENVEIKKQCLETIKSIYYRIGKYEKSQEVADQINSL